MNKITPIVEKYLQSGSVEIIHPTIGILLKPGPYRGDCPFQQEKALEDIHFIKELLQVIYDYGDCVDLSWKSQYLIEVCETFGLKPKVLKKNILPTLSRLGLIGKHTKNWDKVCLSQSSLEVLNLDIINFKEFYRGQIRNLIYTDITYSSQIQRIGELIDIFGSVYWWEIWFCLRVDVSFEIVIDDVKKIRKEFNISKTKYIPSKINEITKLFDEHDITSRKFPNIKLQKEKTTVDFLNLRNMISNSWGNKFTYFDFKIQGSGQNFILDSIYTRQPKKVKRTLKKDTSYLKYDNSIGYDCHHIVPHDYGHYNPEFHSLIENVENGILISEKDHNKFPKKNNEFVKFEIIGDKIVFKSYKNSSQCIILEDIDHLDLEKLESRVEFNKKIVKKLF